MFANPQQTKANGLATPASVPYAPHDCDIPQDPEIGVQSATKDLEAQIGEALNLAGNLRSSLGISVPEKGSATSVPGTLAGYISMLANRLRAANDHFGDVLRHLNN